MDKWSNSIEEYSNAISEQEENSGKNTLEDYNSNNNGGTSKKKGLALKIIIGIVAVLLVGGGVVWSVPTLRNSLYLTILSPKSYYIATEAKNVKKIAENIGGAYERRVEKLNSQKKGTKKNKAEIKFDMNKQLAGSLGIDKILPVEFLVDGRTDFEKNKKQMTIECKLGEEKLIGMNMLMDLGKEEFYMQIPQLSSAYLHTSQKEATKQDSKTQQDLDKYQKVVTNYLNDPTTKKFISNLITRYGKLIFETPEDVSIEKKAEYSVNNVKKSMTKITVSVTASDVKVWCGKIVEIARKDKELKEEMIRLGICEEDEYSKLIDEMEKILNEDEEKDSGKLVMDVWVDNRGNIVGREISVFDGDKKNSGFYYFTDKQDGTDYLEISLYDMEDNTSFMIKGSGKEEESGYKGEAVLESKEGSSTKTRANLSFDNVKAVDKKNSAYNGNFALEFDSFSGGKLQITLTGEEDKQNIKMEASVKGEKLGFIEMNQSLEDCEEIAYPPKGTIYDMQKTEDMEKYMADMDETEMSKMQERFYKIVAIFGSSEGDNQIGKDVPGILSPDENKEDETGDGNNKEEDENASQTNSEELYIIKKAPKTKDDLPKGVEIDENDFYSYDVSDEMVKENGEASNAEPLFARVTMKKSSSQIEKLIESVLGKCSKTTVSRNTVYGSIGEYASLNTSFLTTDTWNTEGDTYESVSISYDTYSNEINEIVISVKNGDKMDKLVKEFLTLWEKDADKSYKEYKKQAGKVKNGDSESFDAGGTQIYYSPDKNGVYCALSAKED
ncbi:MAG: hypothetical protein K2N51_03335 [Lachnospiraceae bacterium]|nr:hypothetical protein [Lachnospiraceae bacterium]